MTELQTIIERRAEETGMTQYVAANNKYLDRFAEAVIRDCAMVVFHRIGPKTAMDVLNHYGLTENN